MNYLLIGIGVIALYSLLMPKAKPTVANITPPQTKLQIQAMTALTPKKPVYKSSVVEPQKKLYNGLSFEQLLTKFYRDGSDSVPLSSVDEAFRDAQMDPLLLRSAERIRANSTPRNPSGMVPSLSGGNLLGGVASSQGKERAVASKAITSNGQVFLI